MEEALKLFFIMAAVVGGPLLAVMAVPALVRRLLPARRHAEGPEAELEDVRARLAEVETLRNRLAELEERVDFAERLLAKQREAQPLPPAR